MSYYSYNKHSWGRPNCSVYGCNNISDYAIFVRERNGRSWEVEHEQFELCSEHHGEFAEFLKSLVLSKIPNRDKEKVEFT